MSYPISYIVHTTLLGLVTLPALVLTVLLLRTPGSRREPSRQWIKYAKLAFGLYTLGNVLMIIANAVSTGSFYYSYGSYDPSFMAARALGSISTPVGHIAAAAVFLSLLYLARAFALLRFDEPSRKFDIGRKWALGAFIWVCLGSVTVMCLSISVWAVAYAGDGRYSYDYVSVTNRNIASFSINLALHFTHFLCAIGALVYIVKTRKKVLGTPLHKASTLMLTCGILWLIRNTWLPLYIILSNFLPSFYLYNWTWNWGFVLDIVLDVFVMFVVLVLLYVLAINDKYAMSRTEEQEQRTKDMEQTV